MAVEKFMKQIFSDEEDHDDKPIIFRRNNTSSRQSQPSSEPRKVSSKKCDVSPGKQSSDRSALNGDTSNLKIAKVPSDTKAFAQKSTTVNSVSTSSQSRQSSVNKIMSDDTKRIHLDKPCGKAYNSGDSDDDNKPLRSRRMDSKKPLKPLSGHIFDDSEDNKPLSKSTIGVSMKKLPGPNEEKPLLKMKEIVKKDPDDSDDDKPLVNRLQSKSIIGMNGSIKKELDAKIGIKRPLGDGKYTEPPLKKAKMSDIKVKHESVVKKDPKAEGNDHLPIAQRLKKSPSSDKQSSDKKTRKVISSTIKKGNKKIKKTMKNSKYSKSTTVPPGSGGGKKWTTLEHSGVIFPPPYKPHRIKMLYNGQPVDLTPEQEEVATMFAVMKDTDYASKPKFIENFMHDWKQILGRNHIIKKFELCDFTPIYEWHLKEKEKKKQMTTEEKKAFKEEKMKQEEKYMWAIVDGVKEKVGNFRVEPPGLFRGRGEHPKMGKLKKRIHPRDITINIGRNAPIPECPVMGERWGEVRHDSSVTWLAYWLDPINQKEFKYVFLAASSSLKGQSDKEKYEKARVLKDYIHQIRANYTKDFSSKDDTKQQIAVATYLIDKLALRAGNEKDDDEADTVGCCTLKVENVVLVPPNKLQFDFLGKDSIRYFNTVEVELPVYKAIGDFRTAKKHDGKKKSDGDDLFDMLDTSKLNAHLKELMPGLTAKVFRTYNASITLDDMLSKEIRDGTLPEKIAVYQHANKEVAIICNHQRSVSKSHDGQMSRLNEKIDELKEQRKELDVDLSRAKKGKPPLKDAEGKTKKNLAPEVLKKKLMQVNAKIEKMELDKKIKEDLKTVALGTSKINYLDPRITVAWCKRHEVPMEKIFNKSLLAKFTWAMDVEPSFRF